jgi:hypothetical protein
LGAAGRGLVVATGTGDASVDGGRTRVASSRRRILRPLVGFACALLATASPVAAGVQPAATCADAKVRATGKASLDVAKAFGKNKKKPNGGRLAGDLSKARSRVTKRFAAAEDRGGCLATGDAPTMEVKVDAFVAEVIGDLCPDATSSTVTSTTSTTSTTSGGGPPCDFTAPPTCGGTCPPGLACGNVGLGECRCLLPGTPCGDAAFPTCGGVCPTPIGGVCLPSISSECACQ